jgi:hypothetical protein
VTDVVHEDDFAAADAPEGAGELVPIEAPEGTPMSPLGLLKGRRAELRKKLHLDLAVPRWGDEMEGVMWIRYGPANLTHWSASQRRREEQHIAAKRKGQPGDPDWAIKANADLLVDACQAVFVLGAGEKPPRELPEELPTFATPELATDLDIQPGNAVRTCLAVYATNGDLLMAANTLLGWSGEASGEADGDFLKG